MTYKPDTKALLQNVWWIGGSGCAGKSTIADRIADQKKYHVYHCDENWFGEQGHFTVAQPDKQPFMCRARVLMEQGKWFFQEPDEYADLVYRSTVEEFEMVASDLLLYDGARVIAEGVSFTPQILQHIAPTEQAVFLVAYEPFQRRRYMERDFAQQWFSALPDPDAAFDNLMKCNDLMAHQCYDAATMYGYKVIVVDETTPLDMTYSRVTEHFGL